MHPIRDDWIHSSRLHWYNTQYSDEFDSKMHDKEIETVRH